MQSPPWPPEDWIACPECGRINRLPDTGVSHTAECSRCGAALHQARTWGLDAPLALSVTGLVLFCLANAYPLISFEIAGRSETSTLISGCLAFWRAGFPELGILVFLTSILFPAVSLVTTIHILLGLKTGRRPWRAAKVFRLNRWLRPWAMIEVYMLGIFVAIVKLADFADVLPGTALFCFAALVLTTAGAEWLLDTRRVWREIGQQDRPVPAAAQKTGLIACHSCHLLLPDNGHRACPRCEAALHRRKPDSLTRSWAILIAAAIFYIPANVFPIMTVISFGRGSPDTILSGIVHLAQAGQIPIAALIFFASIFVPILKISLLAFLLVSVQRGWRWRPRDRAFMYRITRDIGRWSMIDIFMISILVGLVQLGAVANVEAGLGAICFAAVVILTMIAAECFDPRLIWDELETPDE